SRKKSRAALHSPSACISNKVFSATTTTRGAAMSRRLLAGLLLCCASVVLRPTAIKAEDAKQPAGKDLFGAAKVWVFHLEIPAKEYEAMQPPAAGFGPPGSNPPAPRNPNDKRERERNLFGVEFPWVQGDFSADGKTYKKIGVRYSGEITYFVSSQGLKRPLKIEFNKFADQRFHGLASLQLHSMPMHPAKGREALAYSVFRAAGVPAPRTAFAEVMLTVPGKYDREYLGLYTVVESVDKQFLADHFGSDNGVLM